MRLLLLARRLSPPRRSTANLPLLRRPPPPPPNPSTTSHPPPIHRPPPPTNPHHQSPRLSHLTTPHRLLSTTTHRPPSIRGGCNDDDDPPDLPLCPGCGVHIQDSDPALPGFFSRPTPKSPDYRAPLDRSRPLPVLDPSTSLSLKSDLSLPGGVEFPLDKTPKPVVCARCHSLRHYGRVKDPSAENLLPDFDFDRMVAPKIISPSGPRSVVLMLADAADFDGSFPRKIARLVAASAAKFADAHKEGKPANVPRTLLVVTKVDLLPSSISPDWLEEWVRQRAHFAGAGRLAGLHMVSAVRGWGVMHLVEHVRELVGTRGNVWAVGAQNAGKSTLINAMGKCAGGGEKLSHLTEAPVPGTTLGIVRVEGILEGQAKLFDTPGILHPYQMTMRLTREEQRLVHINKELRPRTYRIKPGHSVHIGGLLRVDIEESSVESIYLTVWTSALLPLHMGKTENASTVMDCFGHQLQPPIGDKRFHELGKWMRREFGVRGNSWDVSSVDIAAAGLGWIAVGLKGDAILGVWTYDGIELVSRSSLIPKRASIFEESGFTVSKVVSQADKAINKSKHHKGEKKQYDSKVKLATTLSFPSDADVVA